MIYQHENVMNCIFNEESRTWNYAYTVTIAEESMNKGRETKDQNMKVVIFAPYINRWIIFS